MIVGRLHLNQASSSHTMSGSILGIKPLTQAVLVHLTLSGARAGPLKTVDAVYSSWLVMGSLRAVYRHVYISLSLAIQATPVHTI